MPRLARLAIAYASGIALTDAGVLTGWSPFAVLAVGAALAAFVWALGLAARAARRKWVPSIGGLGWAFLFCGLGGGNLAGRLEEARRGSWYGAEIVLLEARVATVREHGARLQLDLDQAQRVGPGNPIPRRLRLSDRPVWDSPFAHLSRGDRVRLRAKLVTPRGARNPGGRSWRQGLARDGIGAHGWLTAPGWVARLDASPSPVLRGAVERLRARVASDWAKRGAGGGLMAALAVGVRGALSARDRSVFRALGVSHLLAISGLHLALVAAALYRLALFAINRFPPRRFDPRTLALAWSATGAAGYALVAGGGVPVRRALVLLLAVGAGWVIGRPRSATAALGLAALWMLATRPATFFDAGAQLSFVACAALLAAPRADDLIDRACHRSWARRLETGLRLSAAAWAATLPLVAATFHVLSPWALPANLVLIPWVGAVLLPAALVASVAAGLGLSPARFALDAGAALADATLALLRVAADLAPGPWLAYPSGSALLLGAGAAVFVVSRASTWARVIGAFGLAGFLVLAPTERAAPAAPRAVFLDVRQGDAAVLQGLQATALIDGGTASEFAGDRGRDVVVPALLALGIRKLDIAVATHADLDHRGGLESVLRHFPVDRLWLPYGAGREPAFATLCRLARQRGVTIEERGAGSRMMAVGDLQLEALWPPPALDPRFDALSGNDRSLVLRARVGGHALLLSGDIEAAAERELVRAGTPLAADVLKLPHHGSRTSSHRDFLEAAAPRVAIASADRDSAFGMPHREVVERVRRVGASLWWTGRDTAVWVGLGRPLWVRGHATRPISRLGDRGASRNADGAPTTARRGRPPRHRPSSRRGRGRGGSARGQNSGREDGADARRPLPARR